MPISYRISDLIVLEMVKEPKRQINYCPATVNCPISNFLSMVSSKDIRLPSRYLDLISLFEPLVDPVSLIPNHVIKSNYELVQRELNSILAKNKMQSYFSYFMEIDDFLKNLSPAKPVLSKIKKLLKETKHEGVRSQIEKFIPKSGDSSPTTVYSNVSTSTGRLTVIKGPNILTAPSAVRNCFVSRKNGRIAQIDIISAEPKFAKLLYSNFAPPDIYEDISASVFNNEYSRKQIKLATICALYGQSPHMLRSSLQSSKSVTDIISKVKNYFGYSKLQQRLVRLIEDKSLSNFLGRPLRTEDKSLALNHYLQSSVAEMSILMFSRFFNKNPDLDPLYVIHDASIFDASPEFIESHPHGSVVDLFFNDWKFEAKISYFP